MTTEPQNAHDNIMQVTNASKHFAGAVALDDVSFGLKSAEVHALLGQNGSGKSTLLKCLAGFHQPDPGWSLSINGSYLDRPVRIGEFRSLGMSFVHQDLALIPSLSVAENLRMGLAISGEKKQIRRNTQRREAGQLLADFGVDLDPAALIEQLRPVDRALIAIVRAVDELRRWQHRNERTGGVLLLDEATAFLDRQGKHRVANLIRQVASAGAGVVVVSHDLKEVVDVADRVTVLRDGKVVAAVDKEVLAGPDAIDTLVQHMTGLVPDVLAVRDRSHAPTVAQEGAISVTGLCGGKVSNFSARFRTGEILGVTGLVGGGWEEIPLLLFGARRATAGALQLRGITVQLPTMNPKLAVKLGLGLVPGNRQEEGLVADLSVRANLSLPIISEFMHRGILRKSRERERAGTMCRDYGVSPQDPELPIQALSGGNQQKAVLAKWLSLEPDLVLLQDPTQGVDVAARKRIHRLVREAARDGMTVLYASADHEEIAMVADRVLVVSDGVITHTLVGEGITEEIIAAAALRGGSPVAHGTMETAT